MFGYNFLLLDTYSKDAGNIFEICSRLSKNTIKAIPLTN